MPTKTIKLKDFVLQLAESAKDYHEWLFLIRFGLATLLENQDVLIAIIADQAVRMKGQNADKMEIASQMAGICDDLKLRFTVTTSTATG